VSILRAELRKLLTLPSLRLTVLLTLAADALLVSVSAPDPLLYVQAGFLVLGVLATASEHQGGDQIRATLLAMPRRLPLLAAKLLTLAAVTAPVAAVAARSAEATAYLTLTTLFAAAVGSLLRRAELAAILLLVGYFVACPLLRAASAAAAEGLPDTGAAPATLWTLAAVLLSGAAFHRRDA
jgi:hypothetical protein